MTICLSPRSLGKVNSTNLTTLAVIAVWFAILVPCAAQKNPYGFTRPPNLGKDSKTLEKIEERALFAHSKGRLMAQSGARAQWSTYFTKANVRAASSPAYVPHAVYGLKNLLRVLVTHAKGGGPTLAEAVMEAAGTLNNTKNNHERRAEILRQGGADLAVLHKMVVDELVFEPGKPLHRTVRNRLETISKLTNEAGLLTAEDNSRILYIVAQSDFETAFSFRKLDEAEIEIGKVVALEETLGVEEKLAPKFKNRIGDKLLEQVAERSARDPAGAMTTFQGFLEFAQRQGDPGPARRLNAALALAEFEIEQGRGPEAYLKIAEEYHEAFFPGKSTEDVLQLLASGAEQTKAGSALALHLRATRLAALDGSALVADRVQLANAAWKRAEAALKRDPARNRVEAAPDYSSAYRTLLAQLASIHSELPGLSAEVAEESGVLSLLLRYAASGLGNDPRATYSSLASFISGKAVAPELALEIATGCGSFFARSRSQDLSSTFELLSPFASRVLAGELECEISRSLFYDTATCALGLGHWEEGRKFAEAALAASRVGSDDPDDLELALMVVQACYALGDHEAAFTSLESAESSAVSAATGEPGLAHNIVRRLASLHLVAGQQQEFGSQIAKADLLSKASSSSSGSGATKPWLTAKVFPSPHSESKGPSASPSLPRDLLQISPPSELPNPSSTQPVGRTLKTVSFGADYIPGAPTVEP